MRSLEFVLMFAALTAPSSSQQHTPAPAKGAAHASTAPTDPAEREKLHQSAMKFIEASDARPRLAQSLDKLLEDGKKSMMQTNPGLDPQFGEEWIKRMRSRVNLDQFVVSTAQVYENYFTSSELEELAAGQLAMKKGQLYTLTPELAQKLKTNSPFIQRDINKETTMIGGRLGSEVGKEIEKEHPEWIKPAPAASPQAKK
jgi:hypothetical protein